jgi:hypothetical protein
VASQPPAAHLCAGRRTSLCLWLAFTLLGQCLAGPYSDVPPEVRQIIENNVIEALSASALLRSDSELLRRGLGPPAILALFALVPAWRLWPQLDRLQRLTLIQPGTLLAVGFGSALYQIRATNLMTPAVPMLGGFLLHALTGLPRSTIFSTLNLGTTILASTPHSVTSVGYHRSPRAFWNGISAFTTPKTLLSGDLPPWLTDVSEGRTSVPCSASTRQSLRQMSEG